MHSAVVDNISPNSRAQFGPKVLNHLVEANAIARQRYGAAFPVLLPMEQELPQQRRRHLSIGWGM